MTGLSFLDIGCCTGSYLAEALHRVAIRVTGIDEAPDKCSWTRDLLHEVKLLQPQRGFHPLVSVLDGRFPHTGVAPHDLVIALSIIHHCEYPLRFLTSLRECTKQSAWIEWELWNPNGMDTRYCVRLDSITDDPLPLVPGALFGRGVYPTERAAIEALRNTGFRNILQCGIVRKTGTAGNRQVFQCQI